MLYNYLKVAFRYLFKRKMDSAISIGGLALGIACCILLVLFVHFEWSFDTFHPQADRLHRVVLEYTGESGSTSRTASAPFQMGPELRNTYPEIQQVIRMNQSEVELERENSYTTQQVFFAGAEFFQAFGFRLLQGSPESVLDSPDHLVLTESRARQLFGSTDVVGETVSLKLFDEFRNYQVAGIAADPPANSSITFQMVLPYEQYPQTMSPTFRQFFIPSWTSSMAETFVRLRPGASFESLEAKLPAFVEEHFEEDGVKRVMKLQPVRDIYLEPGVRSAITQTSSPLYSWVLGGIALMVLIIACINFMSLTLSKASGRLNEIGIRKTAGAGQKQLVMQFLGEALFTCGIAFLLGMILAEFFLPYLREMTGKAIPYVLLGNPALVAGLGGLLLLSALVTGLYPALVLSRKKVSDSLHASRSAAWTPVLVKGLIVIQFVISTAFVISALVMHRQMDFISQKDLGFNEENLVLIRPNASTSQGREIYTSFEPQARRIPGVRQMSATFGTYGNALMPARLDVGGEQVLEAGLDVIDTNHLETLGISLLQGRGFSEERPADLENGVLVNQTFVQSMGWEQPIGKEIPPLEGVTGARGNVSVAQTLLEGKSVIGVISDYHYQSLYNSLKPQMMVSSRAFGGGVGTIWVRIEGGALTETLASLEETWKELAPTEPFIYDFLDGVIARQYEEERSWREIVDISSIFAIALACFGLIGLAALSAQRRTKEIGIRKVLGATVTHIVALLSKDFVKLVSLGLLLAVPVSWYAMNRWLADFAYRIELGPGIFLAAGGAALLIAVLTVSWQSLRAALANPVDSLRSE